MGNVSEAPESSDSPVTMTEWARLIAFKPIAPDAPKPAP
jgi:hypothetical protein